MDYFDRMEAAMEARFSAMNEQFESAMRNAAAQGDGNGNTQHYTKTVSRTFNGAGNCGEETIVERDSRQNKEVTSVTRRIGDKSIQHVQSKDLASGDVQHSINRRQLAPEDDEKFNADWAQVEKNYLPASRGLLHASHDHHHAAAKQLEDRKK